MSGIVNIKSACLDTSIFIYFYESNAEFEKFCRPIFQKIAERKLVASTSVITITELFSAPFVTNQSQILHELSALEALTIHDVDYSIALKAAQIRRDYHIHLGDALQLATSICSKSAVFITNDKDLKKFKEIPVVLISEI